MVAAGPSANRRTKQDSGAQRPNGPVRRRIMEVDAHAASICGEDQRREVRHGTGGRSLDIMAPFLRSPRYVPAAPSHSRWDRSFKCTIAEHRSVA
jgi:hypothetical protein